MTIAKTYRPIVINNDTYISQRDAAKMLGTTRQSVRNLVAAGRFGIFRTPTGFERLRLADVQRLAEQCLIPATVGV